MELKNVHMFLSATFINSQFKRSSVQKQPHNKYNYRTSPIVITTNKRIILKVTIVIVVLGGLYSSDWISIEGHCQCNPAISLLLIDLLYWCLISLTPITSSLLVSTSAPWKLASCSFQGPFSCPWSKSLPFSVYSYSSFQICGCIFLSLSHSLSFHFFCCTTILHIDTIFIYSSSPKIKCGTVQYQGTLCSLFTLLCWYFIVHITLNIVVHLEVIVSLSIYLQKWGVYLDKKRERERERKREKECDKKIDR